MRQRPASRAPREQLGVRPGCSLGKHAPEPCERRGVRKDTPAVPRAHTCRKGGAAGAGCRERRSPLSLGPRGPPTAFLPTLTCFPVSPVDPTGHAPAGPLRGPWSPPPLGRPPRFSLGALLPAWPPPCDSGTLRALLCLVVPVRSDLQVLLVSLVTFLLIRPRFCKFVFFF